MTRNIEMVQRELETMTTSAFITKWILEYTPYIFENQRIEYIEWREKLATKLKIDTCDIIITGSASLGFSLNKHKNFKRYNEKSDIDVSIISNYYFDIAWHDLLQIKTRDISNAMKLALDDHRSRLIYWGTIATDKILPLLSFGHSWNDYINESRTFPALQDREINFRIYKDSRSIRNYLSISVEERKNTLLEAKLR